MKRKAYGIQLASRCNDPNLTELLRTCSKHWHKGDYFVWCLGEYLGSSNIYMDTRTQVIPLEDCPVVMICWSVSPEIWANMAPLFDLSFPLSSSFPLLYCLCGGCYLPTPRYACLVPKQSHANRLPNIFFYPYALTVCKMYTATLFRSGFMLHICIHENTHWHAPLPQSHGVSSDITVQFLWPVGGSKDISHSCCRTMLCMQGCEAWNGLARKEKYREGEIPSSPGCKTIRL